MRGLLGDGEIAGRKRTAELVIADTGLIDSANAGIDAVTGDERLIRPEVPVLKAMHQTITQRVEFLGCPRLRNSGTAAGEYRVEG